VTKRITALKKQITAQKSASTKRGRGRPKGSRISERQKRTLFQPGNPWRIAPGQTLNPGGRPKQLSNAYTEWLGFEDDTGITNAAKVALAIGTMALAGDIAAAR
jgi:hypothetical protein